MRNFLNDYSDIAHPKVLEKLLENNNLNFVGYGKDEACDRARELIKREIKRDAYIQFVSGGTVANILSICCDLKHYEAVACADTGHIVGHETASIEAVGHKVVTLKSDDGKVKKDSLKALIEAHSVEIDVKLKVLYISQTTELGTVYSIEEIKELYEITRSNDMYLYIDGARITQALAAKDQTLSEIAEVCDIFTIGGTKNGCVYGEAVVILNDNLKDYFRYFMKQKGAMMAKSFVIGLSFEALFEDGLYYELGKRCFKNAALLFEGLKSIGLKPIGEISNQVFVRLDQRVIEALKETTLFEVDDGIVRFVVNYRTEKEDINSLIDELKELHEKEF